VLVDFVDAPKPPVRLPLGSDMVAAIEGKHSDDAALVAEWRSVSVSTDFAGVGSRQRRSKRKTDS